MNLDSILIFIIVAVLIIDNRTRNYYLRNRIIKNINIEDIIDILKKIAESKNGQLYTLYDKEKKCKVYLEKYQLGKYWGVKLYINIFDRKKLKKTKEIIELNQIQYLSQENEDNSISIIIDERNDLFKLKTIIQLIFSQYLKENKLILNCEIDRF